MALRYAAEPLNVDLHVPPAMRLAAEEWVEAVVAVQPRAPMDLTLARRILLRAGFDSDQLDIDTLAGDILRAGSNVTGPAAFFTGFLNLATTVDAATKDPWRHYAESLYALLERRDVVLSAEAVGRVWQDWAKDPAGGGGGTARATLAQLMEALGDRRLLLRLLPVLDLVPLTGWEMLRSFPLLTDLLTHALDARGATLLLLQRLRGDLIYLADVVPLIGYREHSAWEDEASHEAWARLYRIVQLIVVEQGISLDDLLVLLDAGRIYDNWMWDHDVRSVLAWVRNAVIAGDEPALAMGFGWALRHEILPQIAMAHLVAHTRLHLTLADLPAGRGDAADASVLAEVAHLVAYHLLYAPSPKELLYSSYVEFNRVFAWRQAFATAFAATGAAGALRRLADGAAMELVLFIEKRLATIPATKLPRIPESESFLSFLETLTDREFLQLQRETGLDAVLFAVALHLRGTSYFYSQPTSKLFNERMRRALYHRDIEEAWSAVLPPTSPLVSSSGGTEKRPRSPPSPEILYLAMEDEYEMECVQAAKMPRTEFIIRVAGPVPAVLSTPVHGSSPSSRDLREVLEEEAERRVSTAAVLEALVAEEEEEEVDVPAQLQHLAAGTPLAEWEDLTPGQQALFLQRLQSSDPSYTTAALQEIVALPSMEMPWEVDNADDDQHPLLFLHVVKDQALWQLLEEERALRSRLCALSRSEPPAAIAAYVGPVPFPSLFRRQEEDATDPNITTRKKGKQSVSHHPWQSSDVMEYLLIPLLALRRFAKWLKEEPNPAEALAPFLPCILDMANTVRNHLNMRTSKIYTRFVQVATQYWTAEECQSNAEIMVAALTILNSNLVTRWDFDNNNQELREAVLLLQKNTLAMLSNWSAQLRKLEQDKAGGA